MSIYEFFRYKVSSKNFLIDDKGNKVTYADIEVFGKMVSKIIPRRSLILFLCENSNDMIKSYVTFIANEIVPILVSKEINEEYFFNLIIKYQPNFILVPNDLTHLCDGYEFVADINTIKIYQCNKSPITINPKLALLIPTSGSTGGFKMVRQSYKNIVSNAEAIMGYLKIREDDRAIMSLPMHYTYGLSIINSHFLAGATVYVTPKHIYEKEFWDFFNESKCTSFANVPYGYELIEKFNILKKRFSHLRYMTQAGGYLPVKLQIKIARFAKENKSDFFVMYGQTEATARISYVDPDKVGCLLGSIGKPIPGGEMYIVDEKGRKITEAMTVGEIVYKGENVALGYAVDKEDLAKEDEWNNTLYTGDLGYFDTNGNFYVNGRRSRFVKILGVRICLDDIEHQICKKFNVQCAVVGSDESLHIFAVDGVSEDEIKEYVHRKININKMLIKYSNVEEIPHNLNGKVDYSLLSKM